MSTEEPTGQPDTPHRSAGEALEDRLLHAEMAAAAAEATAAEARQRGRRAVKAATLVALVVVIAGAAFYVAEEQRVSRRIRSADRAHAALARAELYAERAEKTQEHPSWMRALEEIRRAAGFAVDADSGLADRIERLRDTLELRAGAVRRVAALEAEAETLTSQGRVDEALRTWGAAIQQMPEYARAHARRGDLLLATGSAGAALAPYRKAWQLLPNAEVLQRLVRALQEAGDVSAAVAAAEDGTRALPRSPEAWTLLGTARSRQRDAPGMLAAWRAALRVDPTHGPARANLERFYAGAARAGEARVVEGDLRPPEGRHLASMAQASLRAGRARQALSLYEAAFEADRSLEEAPVGGTPHRTNAAAAAARLAADDADPELDDAARQALRAQVLAWLEADLALWRTRLEAAPEETAPEVLQQLTQWKGLSAFASTRAPASGGLGDAEARAFEMLWAEVDALLERAKDVVAETWSVETARRIGHAGVLLALGEDLVRRGRLQASLDALRRADQLARKTPVPGVDTARLVREAEARVDRETGIPAVLDGSAEVSDAEELADMAQIRLLQDRHGDALRLYEMLLSRHPGIRTIRPIARHRYNAACAALRVAEAATSTEAAALRGKALLWLGQALAQYRDAPKPASDDERRARRAELAWWKADPDLASVRGEEALRALARESERTSWAGLWRDLDRALE